MKSKKFIAVLLGTGLALTGVVGGVIGNNLSLPVETSAATIATEEIAAIDTVNMFSKSDLNIDYDESNSKVIILSDETENTVTISDGGTYILRGSLSNGQVIVDAEKTDKVQLVLDGVTIGNKSSAPIYIKQADKVFITLVKGSKNTLSNDGEFIAIDDNNIDGVIYSKEDLTINGEGTLNIQTENGHGIVGKDDLVLAGGNYTIKASGHGISGKDSVRIADGTFKITATKDGIHSENKDDASLGFVYIQNGSFDITAEGDGIDAAAWIQVDDGKFQMTTGGGSQNAVQTVFNQNKEPQAPPSGERPQAPPSGEVPQAPSTSQFQEEGKEVTSTTEETANTPSTKGIKAGGDIVLKSGAFTIDSADDSIHSNSNVVVKDGEIKVNTGDDAIHADSNVTIEGGTIDILKSYEGIEGESIDIKGGNITVNASDDGFNASGESESVPFQPNENCYINIEGGTLKINADGDGIDSNGNLYVKDGEIYVEGPLRGADSAVDYDGTGEITGGVIVGLGTSGMVQNFGNSSTQGSMLVNLQSVQSGKVTLKDAQGKEIVSYTPSKQYSSVVISTPNIKKGEKYTLVTGEQSQEIEMTEIIYGNSKSMGRRPNKGMGGQRPMENRGEMPKKQETNTQVTLPEA